MRPEDRLNLDELDKMKRIMDVQPNKTVTEENGPSESFQIDDLAKSQKKS